MRNLSGEEWRIQQIAERVGTILPLGEVQIRKGIGDDTAVVWVGNQTLLLTVDMLVEGIHFRLDWTDAYRLGWKSLAVNLSDIGAMGGQPVLALLSMAMPENLNPLAPLSASDPTCHSERSEESQLGHYRDPSPSARGDKGNETERGQGGEVHSPLPLGEGSGVRAEMGEGQGSEVPLPTPHSPLPIPLHEWLTAFADGFRDCAQTYHTALVGGDTNRSDKLIIDVVVLGVLEGEPVLRSGAQVGDWILVTGMLGGSRAGLMRLMRGEFHDPEAIEAHLKPIPRVREGQLLRQAGVSAMMDISDGVASDLPKLLRASGVGAVVYPHRVPIHPSAQRYAEEVGENPALFALQGGEDYELLVCAPPDLARKLLQTLPAETGTPLTWIGVIEAGDSLWLEDELGKRTPFELSGWSHF